MPFIQRMVKPVYLKKHDKKSNRSLFEDFNEVNNYTMAGAVMQLANLCRHAEEIFGELNKECLTVNKRCRKASQRIQKLQIQADSLDHKAVKIPVSDLDVEQGIPYHLQYRSPNSIEEDLFTMDSRIPCVIHLHQKDGQDLNYLLRGVDAYSKSVARPKSLDPRLLMDEMDYEDPDAYSSRSPRNSSFFSTSSHVNNRVNKDQESSTVTPDQKMKIDSSSSNIDIIKVDTSGAKFERQANLRRSQRLSSTSQIRQRANASQRRQLRHKHKTLTGLPSEIVNSGVRPYSLHSDANNSYIEGGLSDESRSLINGHVVSPNQRNAEIQTDDVKVLPITPSQRRMKQKTIKSHHASPASSHGSTEFLESPTAVPCPIVPKMKQSSTPINGVHDRDLIRPNSLDVKNEDTSTDEGRHTGESNPPTPVRNATPQELSASPQLQGLSPITSNVTNDMKPSDIAMRMNGARLQQGEDRASSGFWSGTESNQHSSTSDITAAQSAVITNALNNMVKQKKGGTSPIYSNSLGKVSPIVDNRPWITSSSNSLSTMSINSKLSTLEDDRYQSTASSVISVTLNRSSNNNSTLSLNSSASDSGTAISAAAMLKKSRKGRINGSSGAYNFMNYEADPLENETEISRTVKNRRSTRSMKHRGIKKRMGGDDTISMSSMADSSPQNTDPDAHSVHSAGGLTNDTTSLCESMFSVEQDGYINSANHESGNTKSQSPNSTISDSTIAATPIAQQSVEVKVTSPIEQQKAQAFFGDEFKHAIESRNNYNSYNRAVNSNHSTPKSLLSPRGKSASVKTPKHVESPALNFQTELNKRLSLRQTSDSKSPNKKGKMKTPPPPPKRASSLSNSASPSPSLSHRSIPEKEISPLVSNISPGDKLTPKAYPAPETPLMSPEVFYMETPPPPPPVDVFPDPPTPDELPDISSEVAMIEKKRSLKAQRKKSKSPPPTKPQRTASQRSTSPPSMSPPPPPPVQVAPKSPEALSISPKPETSPKNVTAAAPYMSIAEQAAAMGNKFSLKKKTIREKQANIDPSPVKPKVEDKPKLTKQAAVESSNPVPKLPEAKEQAKLDTKVDEHAQIATTASAEKVPPPTAPKSTSIKVTAPVVAEKTNLEPEQLSESVKTEDNKSPVIKDNSAVKIPPPTAPKSTSIKPTNKTPPKVSPKPTSPAESSFENKRTREQSPSYRASVARAAFFSSVSPPAPKTETKPKKVPLVEPTAETTENKPDEIPITHESKESTENQKPDTNKPEDVTDNQTETTEKQTVLKVDKNEIEVDKALSTTDDSEKQTSIPEPIDEATAQTPDSVDWLEKIEEFSGPNRAPSSPSPEVPAEQDSAAARLGLNTESAKQSPKFSTYENLMSAIHKSKRETLSGKSIGASPPSSPGTNNEAFSYKTSSTNGNKSPGNTLERKRNSRLSSNGHRNGISRKSNGGTSRDDFKALLLQNACRGTSGSQMTATEKLLRNKPSASALLTRQRPASVNDILDSKPSENEDDADSENTRPVFTLSDIRSAITSGSSTTGRQGRPNRRGNRTVDAGARNYATMSVVYGKKHPPPSMSSKYNTRSRTPTRPMMAISEDSETEKSPEQIHKMTER
uniref:proteoglycan 4-like isoform X1 n=1 Tax=Styela clava TaxID=7725 RepID=UPI00193A2C81|nr:proteoglycan 4-like isoform X1 [Styela clava]